MTMIRMVRRYFAANRRICRKIEPYLPQAKTNMYDLYERVVAQYMNSRADQTIVDVGGGKSCPFAKYRDPAQKARIIAVDISEEELKHNTDVDEKRVANVLQSLPLGTEEADLITSRLVLEHLESLDSFVASSRQALKRGGYFIHLFPCKYAPFALINQTLPHALSKKVLYFFRPEEKDISGFSAFYDNCYYSGISKLLRQYDFEVVDIHPSYFQSPYFNFFVPLFLVRGFAEITARA
jgi:SAM-dependent methyltransferase